ncbi:MAG: DHHA1 domain-containing protein, partial [Fimbriimonadales bacterium]
KDEDTEGFVNELLSIETVKIAAIFRESKRGRVRISFRSRDDYNVASVAQEFGGGGHRNAAGCALDGHAEEIMELVVPRLKACLASS